MTTLKDMIRDGVWEAQKQGNQLRDEDDRESLVEAIMEEVKPFLEKLIG